MQVQAYLTFDGRCEEAIEFYRAALGAEVLMLMRFADAPAGGPGEGCAGGPAPAGDKIMHCALRIGETTLMASDGMSRGQPSFQGFSLALSPPDATEADRLFASLASGGQVQMPLAATFFASRFGMVADKFGVSWMIVVAPIGEQPASTEARRSEAASA
jgi:PhnB protein